MEYINYYDSPLGRITLASDGEYLTGLWIDGQRFYALSLTDGVEIKDLPIFDETKKWLDTYFDGKDPGPLPPTKAKGTAFREKVWEILKTIPFGQTMSYGEIAKKIAELEGPAKKMSAQAVGGAVGHNPISIIIPCHRVIGSDGSLVGYGGGLDKKEVLLKIEGIL